MNPENSDSRISAYERMQELETALRDLIEAANSMDIQIEGEWGISTDKYHGMEDPAITKAREVLGDPPLDWRPPRPKETPSHFIAIRPGEPWSFCGRPARPGKSQPTNRRLTCNSCKRILGVWEKAQELNTVLP